MHYIAKLCSTSTRKLCWSRLIQLCWIELLQSRAVFITNWGKNCKTLLKNGASIITKWHNFFNRFVNRIIKKDGTVEKLKQRRLTPVLISITAKLFSNYLCGVSADTNIKSGYYNLRTIFKRYVEWVKSHCWVT